MRYAERGIATEFLWGAKGRECALGRKRDLGRKCVSECKQARRQVFVGVVMIEKTFQTPSGDVHYWVNVDSDAWVQAAKQPALVLLPGLTADHRLFDKQVDEFAETHRVITWDAPGHLGSRPFALDFSLVDKARWVHDILQREGVKRFVLVGQSMGAYVAQAFLQEFPGEAAGFVSIDSAPLQRSYYTGWELWLLERMEPVYRWYPRPWLLKQGPEGVSETEYGRDLMCKFIEAYEQDEYAALSGHGFRMLAEAVKRELPYEIDCPALLLCGEHDKAGSTKRYNRVWAKRSRLPIRWISGAGHNSNADDPEFVNAALREFLAEL